MAVNNGTKKSSKQNTVQAKTHGLEFLLYNEMACLKIALACFWKN